ncbi:MAG: hypothetical protein JWQ95_6230 [Sphaerisporangium sp.]|nr:hypothetical protein [Sphaerisporangium sp.]
MTVTTRTGAHPAPHPRHPHKPRPAHASHTRNTASTYRTGPRGRIEPKNDHKNSNRGSRLSYTDNLIPSNPAVKRRLSYLTAWNRAGDPRIALLESHGILAELEHNLTAKAGHIPHPVARHLSAAALALRTGRDLLNTHFSSGRPTYSDWANAIEHFHTRRALMSVVADHAHQLAAVLDHTRPALRRLGLPGDALDRSITALDVPLSLTTSMTRTPSRNDATLAAIPYGSFPRPIRSQTLPRR